MPHCSRCAYHLCYRCSLIMGGFHKAGQGRCQKAQTQWGEQDTGKPGVPSGAAGRCTAAAASRAGGNAGVGKNAAARRPAGAAHIAVWCRERQPSSRKEGWRGWAVGPWRQREESGEGEGAGGPCHNTGFSWEQGRGLPSDGAIQQAMRRRDGAATGQGLGALASTNGERKRGKQRRKNGVNRGAGWLAGGQAGAHSRRYNSQPEKPAHLPPRP